MYPFRGNIRRQGAELLTFESEMANKAHTATIRRICERYGGVAANGEGPDIVAGDLIIEVETSATLVEGVERLLTRTGNRYIAVTNKEAVADANRLTAGTGIGVMDPHGNIIHPAAGADGSVDNLSD
jgi:predicted SpoU family rRNA methylase